MKKVNFSKITGSGNDFIVMRMDKKSDNLLKKLAISVCNRKYGVGSDGLLVLEKTAKADIRMRIFNADGSEAEMCGNGARCAAFYLSEQRRYSGTSKFLLETKAGIVESLVSGKNVKIKLTEPSGLKLNIPVNLGAKVISVNFINTGVPHAVIFVEGLDKIDVDHIGCLIRNHAAFSPKGTNVNFVEPEGRDAIRVRTYERGVEAETLACGTGVTASALVSALYLSKGDAGKVRVITKGRDVLKVSFEKDHGGYKNVWLEGAVSLICKGVYFCSPIS
jgi:diaminopimelate epimerase